MITKKNVLLFSTLNPYPFWAGSETYWFDFVRDERVRKQFDFHIGLADSPATRAKGAELTQTGTRVSFYRHFNVNFLPRNIYRGLDRVRRRGARTLPWYDTIRKEKCDLVWFNAAALADLPDLAYGTSICRELQIPYWIILQHGSENFFVTSEHELETVRSVAAGAKRFVFIAKRNRASLERAIAMRLENAFHSVNALPPQKLAAPAEFAQASPVGRSTEARFFSLGRFSPVDKGQQLLLEALAGDKWRGRDWRLEFIGPTGFGREYLIKLGDYYGLGTDRIVVTPHTDDVLSAIGRNDVLLMPSLAEGMPYAMIEAMACSRPAMGTPVGGIPELIEDGRTGWLAKTIDVADIREALERTWQDRSQWQEFGENARSVVALSNNEETTHAELLRALLNDFC